MTRVFLTTGQAVDILCPLDQVCASTMHGMFAESRGWTAIVGIIKPLKTKQGIYEIQR